MAEGCCVCACYKRGAQDIAEATYVDNLHATAQREAAELARQDVQRWTDR